MSASAYSIHSFMVTSERGEALGLRTDEGLVDNSSTQEGSMSADLKDTVAFEIGYSVPEVQAVFAMLNDRVLHIWAVVPKRDRSVYRKIYAKEKEIIRQFDSIDFDFNVISSNGRNPEMLISDPDVRLSFLRD